MENKTKIAGAVGAAAVLVLAGFAGAGFADDSAQVKMLQEKLVALEQVEPVVIEKIVEHNNTIKVPFEVEKIVYQDNENLGIVMDFVQDNVDEDVTVDYIMFEMDARIEAEAWINSKIVSFLDDEDYFADGEVFDNFRKSEVSVKKISDATVLDRDFEDEDLVLQYEVRMKAKEEGEDKVYVDFLVSVPFESGKIQLEDVEVELVE